MRALQTTGHGDIVVADLATVEPGPGGVAIAVHSGTVNPVDAVISDGRGRQMGLLDGHDVVGLGWDLVGRVVAVGDGVDLTPGDEVAAVITSMTSQTGALAEQVTLPAADVAPVPAGLSLDDAAVIGMNALTAAQALELLGAPAGRALLVTGAAGAVGGFAVELAAHAGWRVFGLARESDRSFVEAAGGDLLTAVPEGFRADAVLDAAPVQVQVGGEADIIAPALADGGEFVSVMGWATQPRLPDVTVHVAGVSADGQTLAELLHSAASGVLTPRRAGSVPLDRASEALAHVTSGGQRGRWVVEIGAA